MRHALRNSAIGSLPISLGILATEVQRGDQIPGRWWTLLWAALIAALVIAIVTTDWFVSLFARRARLKQSDTISEENRYTGHVELLQVVYGAIYNDRVGGGDSATATNLEPVAEAFDITGKRVAKSRGSWGYEHDGTPIRFATLRPTRAEHQVELVAKYPHAEQAWIAGARNPQLPAGEYILRVTVAGDGLKEPATFEWHVRNPGSAGRLVVTPATDAVF